MDVLGIYERSEESCKIFVFFHLLNIRWLDKHTSPFSTSVVFFLNGRDRGIEKLISMYDHSGK